MRHVIASLASVAALSLVVAACAEMPEDTTGDNAGELALSAADQQRILDLVNYPGTDEALLDGTVKLDSRAAKNLIAKRNGADGISPSADDFAFAKLDDVDAVSYVGTTAMQKLLAYATAHPAPAGETVKGVAFKGWESQAVVFGVNNATQDELDVFLDSRAAKGLVAKRPFTSVAEIAKVSYVGAQALTTLRAHAPSYWTVMHGTAPTGCIEGFEDTVQPHLAKLLFLSESDRPLDIVVFRGAGTTAPTAASFYALLGEPADWSFEVRDPNNYLDNGLELGTSDASDTDIAIVKSAVGSQLTDVGYIAVHQPGTFDAEVHVYLFGRTACGDLVAIHAISIET